MRCRAGRASLSLSNWMCSAPALSSRHARAKNRPTLVCDFPSCRVAPRRRMIPDGPGLYAEITRPASAFLETGLFPAVARHGAILLAERWRCRLRERKTCCGVRAGFAPGFSPERRRAGDPARDVAAASKRIPRAFVSGQMSPTTALAVRRAHWEPFSSNVRRGAPAGGRWIDAASAARHVLSPRPCIRRGGGPQPSNITCGNGGAHLRATPAAPVDVSADPVADELLSRSRELSQIHGRARCRRSISSSSATSGLRPGSPSCRCLSGSYRMPASRVLLIPTSLFP